MKKEIESHKHQRFCHICKQKFYDDGDSNDSNESNNDSNNKEFYPEKFHVDGDEIHDVGDDNDNKKFSFIKFHKMGMTMIAMMRNLIP